MAEWKEFAERTLALRRIAERVRACRCCSGLNKPGATEAAPGYGSPISPIAIVGQSLCGPRMRTQVPFTGGCGRLLDRAFEGAGIEKNDLFITNVVHCHPPNNRRSLLVEKQNCAEYLRAELAAVKPKLVIGLGADARDFLTCWAGARVEIWKGARTPFPDKNYCPLLLLLPHPAYVLRRPTQERAMYLDTLTKSLRWGFRKVQAAAI
jgi:uracil-DNA glycosylase family 4